MRLQAELAARVVPRTTFTELETVAGVDIAVKGGIARAAAVLLRYSDMEVLETRTAIRPLEFPYVPGLLAFRELPSILDAFGKLSELPDLVLTDGHGYAHPRRFGIGCYLGVELDLPTIGVGKSRLVGEHREPGEKRGCRTQLRHKGEVIGAVLRTRERVKPVYVSIGHRVDLSTAVRVVLKCARGFRLPEPTRAADRAAGRIAV